MHLDGARDEVGATVEPIRLIHPDVLLGIFQGFLVGRTVFEPKQIARGRTRLIVGVKPDWLQRMVILARACRTN